MLTCDPILFKCSNNWYQSGHGRHLSCIFWVILVLSFFFVTEAFFFFSLRLVFILGFQARLRLDTGRECCLEQNPSLFVVFWSSSWYFENYGLFGSCYYAFFLSFFPFFCAFLGLY